MPKPGKAYKAVTVAGSVVGEGFDEFHLVIPDDTDMARFKTDEKYVDAQTIASAVSLSWANQIAQALTWMENR